LLLAAAGCGTFRGRDGAQPAQLDAQEVKFAEALAHYGQGLLNEGQHGRTSPAATREFKLAAELDPTRHRVRSRLAMQALLQGRTDDAVAELEASCDANPESLRAWLDLARICHVSGRFDEAARHYRRAIELDPSNEDLYMPIARIRFHQEKDRLAIAIMKEGLHRCQSDSELLSFCHERGREFIVSRQLKRAVVCFEFLAAREPREMHQYHYLLGELHRKLGNDKQAIRFYAIAATKEDPLPDTFLKLAMLQVKSSAGRAIETLEEGKRRLPDSPLVLRTLAYLYRHDERFDEAILLYETVETLVAKSKDLELKPSFFLNYGSACEQAGQRERAEEIFERCLELHPNTPQVLNYLAYMWAERAENLDKAFDYVKRALELDPERGAYLDTLGWVYHMQKKYSLALREILRADEVTAGDPTIVEHLGDTYLALGEAAKAISQWRRSYLINPDSKTLADKLSHHSVDMKVLRKQAKRARKEREKVRREEERKETETGE